MGRTKPEVNRIRVISSVFFAGWQDGWMDGRIGSKDQKECNNLAIM